MKCETNYYKWICLALIAGIVIYALSGSRSLSAIAPFLVVLICPLSMLFMMKGMHGKDEHDNHKKDDKS